MALDSVRTPFGEAEEALGGSASYFAFSASHFAPVRIVAVVGDDFPAAHRELFDRRGDRPERTRDGWWPHVPLARRIRCRAGPRAHARDPAQRVLELPSPARPTTTARARSCSSPTSIPSCRSKCWTRCETPRLTVSDTMNYWIARKPERVLDVLRRVDVAAAQRGGSPRAVGRDPAGASGCAAGRAGRQGGDRQEGRARLPLRHARTSCSSPPPTR